MNSNNFMKDVSDRENNNYYRLSLIQFPANILSGKLSYGFIYNDYFIQSNLSNINYGKLQNSDGDSFIASDNMLELAIVRQYENNFCIGSSLGYSQSKIGNYINQILVHGIGIQKSDKDNKYITSLAIENMIRTIQSYSNVDIDYSPHISFGLELNMRQPGNSIGFNYVIINDYNDELIISTKTQIKEIIDLYIAKSFYILSEDSIINKSIFDKLSFGIDINFNPYQFDCGMQYHKDYGFIVGTSLTINIK
tara:strand:- start:834 stop:1586 length:753 start_codon:yes stop_codon:yes gene_type:complete